MRNAAPQGSGADLLAGNRATPTKNPAFSQPTRREFRVIVARDLWRRCIVCVEPATCSRQPVSFPGHGEAMAYAEALARLEGWPLIDRTGGAE